MLRQQIFECVWLGFHERLLMGKRIRVVPLRSADGEGREREVPQLFIILLKEDGVHDEANFYFLGGASSLLRLRC